MNRNDRNPMIGRVRLAVAVLAGAMILPGLAVASHTTCTPGSSTNPCKKFEPDLIAGAQVKYTDTPSSLSWRTTQADHDMPVVDVTYLAPRGWQFAVNTLRPGQAPGGGAAANCNDVYDNEGTPDSSPATLARAENLAGGVGTSMYVNETRPSGSWTFGYRPSSRRPSVAFVGYNAASGTAQLCMYLFSDQFIGTEGNLRNPPLFDPDDTVRHEARELLIPVTMRKITPGEMLNGDDISVDFGWRFDFSYRQVWNIPFLWQQQASIFDSLFYIDALTGGAWHIDEATGERAWLEFSKTPVTPGDYEFRAVYATCRDGLQDPAANAGQVCRNGALTRTQVSVFQEIKPPPSATILDFAKLRGPAGPAPLPANFGIVRGSNSVQFSWAQPAVAPGETIKGYLLTVARPGDQDSRHFRNIITNPLAAGFNPAVCGAAGTDATCTLSLNFPLSTIGNTELKKNGKYDVSLVTLYESAGANPDRRSDGLCDDGIGIGIKCPVSMPAFRIVEPGVSTWQFLLREKAWPRVYVENQTIRRTGGGPTFTAPAYVLLVDFALRQAEFVIWNPLAFEESFFAPSNAIVGDNATGIGMVSFGSSQTTGHSDNWRFDGYISPVGSSQTIPVLPCCVAIGNVQPFPNARGVFSRYNLQGLPGAIPPGGLPQLKNIEAFEGNPLA